MLLDRARGHDLGAVPVVPVDPFDGDVGVTVGLATALDLGLVVGLVEPERDDIRVDDLEDVVDVALGPQPGAVDDREGIEQGHPGPLVEQEVLALHQLLVATDDDKEFVPVTGALAEVVEVPGVEHVEGPLGHDPAHWPTVAALAD